MKTFNQLFINVSIGMCMAFGAHQASAQIANFPYTEDFGSSGCSLPTGYSNSGSDPWDFQNVSEVYMEGLDHTSGGGCFASMDDTGSPYDDSCILTSPVFDLTSVPTAQLTFWWQNSNSTTSQPSTSGIRPWSNLYVDVSTNGGMTWNRGAWMVEDSQQIGWTKGVLELLPYISNQTVFRFRGLETHSFYSDLSLDDIHIYQPFDYDVGITDITGMVGHCPGSVPVTVSIKNFGRKQIMAAIVHWTVNGVLQTPVNFMGSLAMEETTTLTLGNFTTTVGNSYDIVAWTTFPNGTADNNTVNDTAKTTNIETALSGTYTVGATGDYVSIAALADGLNKRGVCGPVTIHVDSATYVGKASFGPITGTSSINTITINGNGASLIDSTSASDRFILRLDSASYITIDNLHLESTSTDYGYGIHLINRSNYNTISNCTIDLTALTSTSSLNGVGILASGSKISTSSPGNNANYCKFINNTIIGGSTGLYYGIRLNGNTGGLDCVGNEISNNTLSNIYANNIYLDDTDSTLVSGNDISRASKSNVTTFYGIYLTAGNQNVLIEKNIIHNTHDVALYLNGTTYGIFFSNCDAPQGSPNIVKNNLLHHLNGNGSIYCIYNSSSDGAHYYHNTISLDHIAATGGTTRGFYQSTTATDVIFQNNIISITRGGSGVKHGVYFNTTASTISCDYNNIYVNSQGSGSQFVGRWNGTDYNTLSTWQAANSGMFDQNSDGLSPNFLNISARDYTPNSFSINDSATPIAGIVEDLYGNVRSSTPDMGAIEFLPFPINDSCANAFSVTAGVTWGTTVRSTADSINACGTSNDYAGGVWYIYEGTNSFVSASLCGASFDTKISVYSGICGSLQCIAGNDDSCNTQSMVGWCSEVNTNYYLLVHGSGKAIGDFNLTITEIPVMQPKVSVSPGNAICANETATLTSDSALAYLWDDLSTLMTRIVNDSGTYYVNIIDSNGCSATSAPVNISLLPIPEVNLGNDTVICENEIIILNAGLAVNYRWSTGDTTRYIVYKGTSGSTTVTVKATGANGCEKIDQISITVDICAGIAENGLGSLINIYPNPNDGTFFIDLQDMPAGIATVNVLDLKGQVVYNDRLESGTANRTKIELNDLNKGMYLIRINVANDWFTGKLIIE